MSKRALVVEDDANIAELLRLYLSKDGFDVMIASDGNKAEADFDLFQPDVVMLDIMLPGKDGWEVCRSIRKKSTTPIIMLTAKGETSDKVTGLEMGADDYVTKPYRVKELLSRISAIFRREKRIRRLAESAVNENAGAIETASTATADMSNQEYRFGAHVLNAAEFRLYKNGEVVECTPSEIRLLREFLRNSGIALTRNQLIEKLYDTENSYIDDNTLSVYIKRLRDKLGDDAGYIKTIKGIGYRFSEE